MPRFDRSLQRGVTLIELLVVMGILALGATIVIVNAPPQREPARAAATAFADMLRGAVDDAVVSGDVLRLEIASQDWRLARFADGEWTASKTSDDDLLAGMLLRAEVDDPARSNRQALTGARAARRERDAPVTIPVDPFGAMPGFTVRFERQGEVWAVRHDVAGAVTVTSE